jgi:hypothetical protein
MSFGARVWGPTGLLELDETSFTVRVIYSGLVTRTAGANYLDIAVSGCDPATCNAVSIPVSPYPADPSSQDLNAVQQEPEVLTGLVRVWFINRNIAGSASPAPALATQRVMVMRYK